MTCKTDGVCFGVRDGKSVMKGLAGVLVYVVCGYEGDCGREGGGDIYLARSKPRPLRNMRSRWVCSEVRVHDIEVDGAKTDPHSMSKLKPQPKPEETGT